MRPQKYQKFPFFGKESPRRGDSLDRFRKFFRGFYTSNYPTLVFQIWHDTVRRLRSYCWETAHQSIRPNFFRAPCRKNYTLDRKMNATFFDGLDELYHHEKFGEDRTMRYTMSVGAKMCFFLLVTLLSPEHRAFEGRIVRTSIALPFIARFRRGFPLFFWRDCSFRWAT